MSLADAVAGQDEPPGQQRGEDGDGPGAQDQAGQDGGLGGQHGEPAGTAARVTWIRPVPYSPLMTITAMTATTAWPR